MRSIFKSNVRWENVEAFILPQYANDIDELPSEDITEVYISVRTDKNYAWHRTLIHNDDIEELGWWLLKVVLDQMVESIDATLKALGE